MNLKCLDCQKNIELINISSEFFIKCCYIQYICFNSFVNNDYYIKIEINKKYFSNPKIELYCTAYMKNNNFQITYRLKSGQKFITFTDDLKNLSIQKINSIIENNIFQ